MSTVGMRYLEERFAWCYACEDTVEREHLAAEDTVEKTAWRCTECATVTFEDVKVWAAPEDTEFPEST